MAEEQDTFKEVYDNLWGAHERELIYYKVMESTLRGGAGQQERIMREKDKRIEELEAQLRELQDWDSADMPNGERVYNTGRGMIQYPFNPEGEELHCMQCSGDEGYLDECICGVEDTPTSYPYTNPIRDIPAYSRIPKAKAFLDDAFNYGISLEGVNVPIGEWGISY